MKDLKKISVSIMLFFFCSIINSQSFKEHVIIEDYGNAVSIAAADLDGDGDIDIVASSFNSNYLAWLENDGFQNFTKHIIAENLTNAFVVDLAHIDNDDDLDIVLAVKGDDLILWFSNDGAGDFTKDTIVSNWESASCIMAKDHLNNLDLDINKDGYTDILASSNSPGDKISWFENDGAQNFTEHILKENWSWARYSTACDIDEDGDVDIIATARNGDSPTDKGDIIWFVNDGFQNFTEDTIVYNWGEPSSVQAADFDKDGDLDLAATFVFAQEVAWFENIDNNFDVKHTIKTNFNGAFSVAVQDYNDDGWLDIAAEAWIGQLASVFYNNTDKTFTEEQFCSDNWELIKIFPTDLDQDGDFDILGAVAAEKDVRWWENTLYEAKFNATPLSGHAPLNVSFVDSSHLNPPVNSVTWDFDYDGIIDSEESQPTWIYENPGDYSVSLGLATDSVYLTVLYEDYISVFNGFSAIEFNSDNTTAICSNSINIENNFTFECWVKPYSFGEMGMGRILDKDRIQIVSYKTGFEANTDSCFYVVLKHEDQSYTRFSTPTNSMQIGEWQHIALSYDGSFPKFYINGQEQILDFKDQSSGNMLENSDKPICFGSNSFGSYVFDGIIDEARLWSSALSGSSISANYLSLVNPNHSNLMGYWKMDEGSGETIFDASSNEMHAILNHVKWVQGKNLESVNIEKYSNNSNNSMEVISYPNPFISETILEIQTRTYELIELEILNVFGEIVIPKQCIESKKSSNIRYNLHANSLTSGVYYCRVTSGKTQKIIRLIKL